MFSSVDYSLSVQLMSLKEEMWIGEFFSNAIVEASIYFVHRSGLGIFSIGSASLAFK